MDKQTNRRGKMKLLEWIDNKLCGFALRAGIIDAQRKEIQRLRTALQLQQEATTKWFEKARALEGPKIRGPYKPRGGK